MSPLDGPAYADRPTTFAGVREDRGWRLKLWDIALPGSTLDTARFEPGVAAAVAVLPQPAATPQRPGVGVLIRHQGETGDYVVLAWWANVNELPIKVWLRDGAAFRPARGDESVCVWDLDVLWREREAYVATVLADPTAPDLDAYLAAADDISRRR